MEEEDRARGSPEGKAWREGQDARLTRLMSQLYYWGWWMNKEQGAIESLSERELVLLLCLTPNLEELGVILPFNPYLACIMQHVRSSLEANRLPLAKLTTVTFGSSATYVGASLCDIIPFLDLPSVTRIFAELFYGDGGFDLEPGSLPIQEIGFSSSVLKSSVLENLVRACKSLRHFELIWDGNAMGVPEKIDFDRIGKAFGKELKSLKLDFGNSRTEYTPKITSLIGSLEHLENLRYLDLPMWAFFDKRYASDDIFWHASDTSCDEEEDAEKRNLVFVNRFPRSLETLTIQFCNPHIFPPVRFCHGHREEMLPNLTRLTICGEELKDACELTELREAFEEIGIAFSSDKPDLAKLFSWL